MSTRRTHMVRVYGTDASGAKNTAVYADIEVLDDVSFRIENNKEVVLKMPAKNAVPYIVDNTDADEGKQPSNGTRRTHVEKLTDDSGATLYVEVFDAAAYRDANNLEWIITGPDPAPYDTTDGSGSGSGGSTRRCHDEKISGSDPNDKHPTSNFITVQRTDMLAFRGINRYELVLKMPSGDDGSIARADTIISNMPGGVYDPTDESDSAAPPENQDPHFYVKFKDGASPLLGSTKIAQGPFWWIRKIKVAGGLVFVNIQYQMLSTKAPPSIPEPLMLKNTPWSAPPMDVFSGNITFPPGSNATVNNSDPVSADMRAGLDQWFVGSNGVVRQSGSSEGTGSVGSFSTYSASTDAASRPSIGPPTADNINSPTPYLGFSAVIGFMQTESVGPNVIINPYNPPQQSSGEGLNHVPYSGCWGIFTDRATAQAACDAANRIIQYDASQGAAGPLLADWQVVQLTPTTTDKRFFATGEASIILNSGKAKTTKNTDGDPVFTFELDVPSSGPEGGWAINACAFDGTVKSFPVDANNSPTFAPFVDPNNLGTSVDSKGKPTSGHVIGVAGGGEGNPTARTLVFTVNTKTLEITVVG